MRHGGWLVWQWWLEAQGHGIHTQGPSVHQNPPRLNTWVDDDHGGSSSSHSSSSHDGRDNVTVGS